MKIREYKSGDYQFVEKSMEELHDFVVSIDPIKRIRKMPGLIDNMLDKLFGAIETNNGKIFIAEKDGVQIGFSAGFVGDEQSKLNLLEVVPSKSGIISDIYVQEEYRGQGIGKKLVKIVEKYLIEQGCDSIWVDTNSFNTSAVGIYESLGYKQREVSLMKGV